MKLEQAAKVSDLSAKSKTGVTKKTTAEKIARRVFQVAAQAGHPFVGVTSKEWAKKWLASEEFVLLDVPTTKVALPSLPHDQNQILRNMAAAADSMEPIVVDLNKRGVGQTPGGFTPSVIVVDGRHRHRAVTLQGCGKIKAWIGIKAAKKLNIYADHDFGAQELQNKLGEALKEKYVPKNQDTSSTPAGISYPWVTEVYPFEDYFIFMREGKYYKQSYTADDKARTVKLTGTPEEVIMKYAAIKAGGVRRMSKIEVAAAMAVPAQDVGHNGSAPHMAMPGMKGTKLYGHGGAGASLGNGSGPTPPMKGLNSVSDDPTKQAPGAGVGKRLPSDKGATKSELQDKMYSADFVGKITTEYQAAVKAGYKGSFKAVAPPGLENMVKGLKKKYGEDSATPFKIAWWKHNQGGK